VKRTRTISGLISAVLLFAAVAGCGGKTRHSSIDVVVTIQRGSGAPTHYELSCPSAKGNFPNAQAACVKLASTKAMLQPPTLTATCAGSEGVPAEVSVKGSVESKPVDFSVRACDEPSARAQAARKWLALARNG